MSFFFRNKAPPKNSSQESELERLRNRQLVSLMDIGAQAANVSQSMFHCVFSPSLFLSIHLPLKFPLESPTVDVSDSGFAHPWIRGNTIVHPDLTNWSVHSDLGRIISEIKRELMSSQVINGATRVDKNTSHYGKTIQQAYNKTGGRVNHCAVEAKANTSKPQSQMPTIPNGFPELEELSNTELGQLLTDKSLLKKHTREMTSVVDFLKLYEQLILGNVSLAESNLQYESQLESLQSQLELHRVELLGARETYNLKQMEQQKIVRKFQPHMLVDRVTAGIKDVDEASELVASNFTNGEIIVSDFIAQYMDLRIKYHLRSVKVARFSSQ